MAGKVKFTLLVLATILVSGTIAYSEYISQPELVTIDVQGMVCDSCAEHIQGELTAVPGVKSAEVSHKSGQARVFINRRNGRSRDKLVEAIVKAGYQAK